MPNCPTPSDPLNSRADIHLTGFAGVLTLSILTVLQLTVFQHTPMPQDMGYVINPVASYVVSITAGRLARKRLVKAATAPEEAPEAPEVGEKPGTAMPGR